MAVQKRWLSWKWNYFEELTNDRVKCIICGKLFSLEIQKNSAKKHFKTQHNKYPSVLSNHSSKGWQSQFTTQNDKMKCKLCGKLCGLYTTLTTYMAKHLKETHETDENKTTKIITYLYKIFYNQNLEKNIYNCKKCSYTFSGDYNKSSDLIKHLIENHHTDIPANIRPKGLCKSSSTSNYDEEADSATSSNYQQPNQLGEVSSLLNYDREDGTATSISYQQPNQSNELSNFSNYDREDGTATSINYQQPNQLDELSSLSNYDRVAGITITDNHQQPNVYSLDSDKSNDLPDLPDVSDDDPQYLNDMINNIYDWYYYNK